MSTRQADGQAGRNAASDPAQGYFATQWGEGLATVWEGRLVEVELPPLRPDSKRESFVSVADKDMRRLEMWVGDLEAYFRGERLSWSYSALALETEDMTVFGKRTIETLMSVPAGSAVSYGDLATLAGFPRAARAVGSLMANNPIPIVIPCHRVIRSDGSLGRYGNDPAWKERLLAHEQRHREE